MVQNNQTLLSTLNVLINIIKISLIISFLLLSFTLNAHDVNTASFEIIVERFSRKIPPIKTEQEILKIKQNYPNFFEIKRHYEIRDDGNFIVLVITMEKNNDRRN